ncbi:ABC-three component system protein [uncultured Amphritea sp.]|uniref:ABC-three component system protein n=1 Tax=uncultured Amphritea sp. TaxID=981605 RepID=UPI00261A958B|nr:ABC-three component system protein [uncultured Amphritea sp.]
MKGESDNSISNVNIDNGDVFIGSKYQYTLNFDPPKVDSDALISLIERYRDLDESDVNFLNVKEELEYYQEPLDSRKVFGLENKLSKAGRKDLISIARNEKHKFATRLLKFQLASQESALHLNLLSKIEERFNAQIFPMIKNNEPFEIIDLAISKLIIDPIANEVAPADATLTAKQIRGMMYLLTGNCYLRWFE